MGQRLSSLNGRPHRYEPSDAELRRFVVAAFRLVSATVPCDFASVLYRSICDGFLREIDSRGRTYPPAFMRRYAELTPAAALAVQNPGVKILPTRDGLRLPQEQLEKTAFYREVMQPQGWRHAVALCFWGDPPAPFPVLVLTANRKENQPDFSDPELRALLDVHDLLDGWVADLLEHATAMTAYAAAASLVGHAGRGFIVLDQSLTVRLADAEGRKLSARWATSKNSSDVAVPPAIREVCQKMYASWGRAVAKGAQVPKRSLIRVVRDRPGRMTGRITMHPPKPDGFAQVSFFVELRPGHVAQRKPPRSNFARVLERLTAAERDVVEAVGAGLSNKETAERLGKTVHAVKFLLHQVYVRTGIPNRTQLALALRRG